MSSIDEKMAVFINLSPNKTVDTSNGPSTSSEKEGLKTPLFKDNDALLVEVYDRCIAVLFELSSKGQDMNIYNEGNAYLKEIIPFWSNEKAYKYLDKFIDWYKNKTK